VDSNDLESKYQLKVLEQEARGVTSTRSPENEVFLSEWVSVFDKDVSDKEIRKTIIKSSRVR
jgi:hypothetical protein